MSEMQFFLAMNVSLVDMEMFSPVEVNSEIFSLHVSLSSNLETRIEKLTLKHHCR